MARDAHAGSVSVGARDPFLAVGMVMSPFNFERRGLMRDIIVRYEAVVAGTVAFRFVIGNAVRPRACCEDESRLRHELRAQHEDMVVVDALDRRSIHTQSSCTETIFEWLQHVLRSWPRAAFYAKVRARQDMPKRPSCTLW